MLPLKNRITKSSDFSQVLNSGKKNYQKSLVVYFKPTSQPSRLGLIISRKVGNAVKRHLLARRTREIFKKFLTENPTGFDLVVKFSTKFTDPTFQEMEAQFSFATKSLKERNIVEN
ncbi:MAG: ribonuclease P protein component [Candidatus Nanopelagicales bacterium]